MGIPQISKMAVTVASKVGKHKVPRYIYHMTSKGSYEQICKSGGLKASEELIGNGVFTTDLVNLFKRWGNRPEWGLFSLQEQLIEQASKCSNEIVILRIPTSKLEQNKLVIRSQNKLFKLLDIYNDNIHTDEFNKAYMEKNPELRRSKICEYLKKIVGNKDAKHITGYTPATESKLYKQRKEAIEFIYRDDIPMDSFEKIGEVNVAELRQTPEYDPIRPMRSIFTALLKDTPEVNGARLLKC